MIFSIYPKRFDADLNPDPTFYFAADPHPNLSLLVYKNNKKLRNHTTFFLFHFLWRLEVYIHLLPRAPPNPMHKLTRNTLNRQLFVCSQFSAVVQVNVLSSNIPNVFKGIVSWDFEWLQMILMNRLFVPDVPLEVYSFLYWYLHIVF